MKERLKYFKVTDFKYGYNIIPNYPNLKLHISKHHTIQNNVIKLVFVGSVGIGRGLEEIIDLLNINNFDFFISFDPYGFVAENLCKTNIIKKLGEDHIFSYNYFYSVSLTTSLT